ncbi:MAG: helix-turn-helix transcriptional regulator [Gammaproteobacteria bacterium]|nr:helix-turn-helix transcriptional regulator [Gammaproteobacteria bacterium]
MSLGFPFALELEKPQEQEQIVRVYSGSPEGEILDPQRPLIATASDISEAHMVTPHCHPRGQLLYAIAGNMRAGAGGKLWAVTPRTGIWVPPGERHFIQAPQKLSYRFVYLQPEHTNGLPERCTPLEMSGLVRELVREAATFGASYRQHSPESRLVSVLRDQLTRLPSAKLVVPLPIDTRARKVCDELMRTPADDRSLSAWGAWAGASGRTLARAFLRDTGMTFGDWSQQLRLSIAVERLDEGDSVTQVALDLGYRSPSAFGAMFRRVLGCSPRRYFS